jgi:hypothetical protein
MPASLYLSDSGVSRVTGHRVISGGIIRNGRMDSPDGQPGSCNAGVLDG